MISKADQDLGEWFWNSLRDVVYDDAEAGRKLALLTPSALVKFWEDYRADLPPELTIRSPEVRDFVVHMAGVLGYAPEPFNWD